jgi:Protein of unknown function with PCYCGC motif
MKKNWILIAGIIVLLIAAVIVVNQQKSTEPTSATQTTNHNPGDRPATRATPSTPIIPAHYEHAPNRASLGPTLAPEKFTGPTREAYSAVREIPVTIAQMPCYCHCDRGMGHKSLYSCFEDDHASHCAVCVNEALLAYKLQKEGKTAAQIRDQINEEFGQIGN